MHDLDGSERPMLVHRIGHDRHRRNIAVVPQAAFVERLTIAGWVNFRFFGRDDRPSALGLDAAQPRKRLRLGPADASAVRHLVETIASRDRPDADRFEQYVVAWVAAHDGRMISKVSASSPTIMSSSSSATL